MDLVVRNARIWTADPARPWATALAVSGGRITAVGEDHDVDAPPGVTTIDAAGQFLMPGIVDSHNHIRLGSGDGAVQLGGATTLAEVRSRIGAWLDENPDAPWVMGEGFDYAVVPGGGHPRAEHLDGELAGRVRIQHLARLDQLSTPLVAEGASGPRPEPDLRLATSPEEAVGAVAREKLEAALIELRRPLGEQVGRKEPLDKVVDPAVAVASSDPEDPGLCERLEDRQRQPLQPTNRSRQRRIVEDRKSVV